jgi:hypothetical protein
MLSFLMAVPLSFVLMLGLLALILLVGMRGDGLVTAATEDKDANSENQKAFFHHAFFPQSNTVYTIF